MSIYYNEKAKYYLQSIGFDCEHEPKWVSGRVPDFFCSGLFDLWVEVKSFTSDEYFEKTGDIFIDLKERIENFEQTSKLKGFITAWYTDNADKSHIKNIINLVKCSNDNNLISNNNYIKHIFILPIKANLNEIVYFEFENNNGKYYRLISYKSEDNKYGLPIDINDIDYFQDIEFNVLNGKYEKFKFLDINTLQPDFILSLVLQESDEPLHINSGSGSDARLCTKTLKIRRVIQDANSQFKNAIKYKGAPCLIMLYDETINIPSELNLISAAYGDLKYNFSSSDSNNNLFVGENGAFNANKNKSTSALCFMKDSVYPLTIHNYWSKNQFPTYILKGKECIPIYGENLIFKEN